mmetsp:Transcript_3323/g.4915  ORF Transcript_3323/g.4915 Transcript_3323/m.4915 type:complete len:121 (+) Transcript_3323:1202-1564(+)
MTTCHHDLFDACFLQLKKKKEKIKMAKEQSKNLLYSLRSYSVDDLPIKKRQLSSSWKFTRQSRCIIVEPQCSNCSIKKTPLWRKGPHHELLCNRCGIYYKRHGEHRPLNLIRRIGESRYK